MTSQRETNALRVRLHVFSRDPSGELAIHHATVWSSELQTRRTCENANLSVRVALRLMRPC